MKAMVQERFGPPDVLKLEDVDIPEIGADDVLVKVHAAALNPADWHALRGDPYIARLMGEVGVVKPKRRIAGIDAAGVVEAVGANVRDLHPGDEVLGFCPGAFAEYARAEVTGVCSTRNVDLVRSLGAAHVVDYTREDFTESGVHYDVIFDNVCNLPLGRVRRALTPKGTLVNNSGGSPGHVFGAVGKVFRAIAVNGFVRQRIRVLIGKRRREDLLALTALIEAGKLTSVVDRTYPLAAMPDGLRHVEQGHARGKIVVTVS